eukprot:TRINITY_DN9271_c0_g1_i1.p1 TRINITY_DN9271_c0_g1~~TRINITY_DN9271_c0_g1_i1.p1  ORF type:complete len:385 (-),score=85.51 TRINITY_DN9271_c0_g1_i1:182-1336(-)
MSHDRGEEDCEGGSYGGPLTFEESYSPAIPPFPLAGDFYREEEDVFRGITLNSLPATAFEELAFRSSAISPRTDVIRTKDLKTPELRQPLRFQARDKPPAVPDDGCFKIEATSLLLNSEEEAPWKAGNRLLDILQEDVTAEIKKVNRQKFTVKAAVLCCRFTCEVKVRGYQTSAWQFAFEFQRVSGDSLAFNGLFRLLKHKLCPPFGEDVQIMPTLFLPPPPAQQEDSDSDSLTPLIDAAHSAAGVSAQAEAAAGLAAAAETEDPCTVKQLCSPGACAAIKKLLEENCFEVSCQVARLLSKLALLPVAEVCFLREGLLRHLLDSVWSLSTGKLLRLQLTQAMHCFAKRCTTTVLRKDADEIEELRVHCADVLRREAAQQAEGLV